MNFYIDTSNISEIKDAFELSIISGVTTNPTIISRSGKSFEATIKEIDELVGEDKEIFAEVLSVTADEMIAEAKEIVKIRKNMVVKLPMTLESIKAISKLSNMGIKTCATICFSPTQALLAANAGANYVAPYLSRIDDIGYDGLKTIAEIQDIFNVYNSKTKLLCASIRLPKQIIELAKLGIDSVTITHQLLMNLMKNPSTDLMISKFEKDWKKVPKN